MAYGQWQIAKLKEFGCSLAISYRLSAIRISYHPSATRSTWLPPYPDRRARTCSRVGLGNCRGLIGAIPRPVNCIGGNTVKIAGLAVITFVLDEKPYFPFHHVVDLFGLVHVGFRMVARRSGGDHQTALVAVAL